jgi:hypothetical protein
MKRITILKTALILSISLISFGTMAGCVSVHDDHHDDKDHPQDHPDNHQDDHQQDNNQNH